MEPLDILQPERDKKSGPISDTGGRFPTIILIVGIIAVAAYFLFSQGILKSSYFGTLFSNGSAQVSPVYGKVYDLNNSGDFKAAQEFLASEIKTNPANGLKLSLANSILNEGSTRGTEALSAPKARDLLFAVENTGDTSAYLYELLGYSYETINDFNKAFEYYNKALAIDPQSVNTLFSIGHTYWLSGDLVKAQEFYGKANAAISATTDNSVKIKVYAALGRMESNPKKSEEYFLKAMPLADSEAFKAELYANLSNARYLQNDLPKALEYADLAMQTDPSNELGYIAYAKAAVSDKNLLQNNLSQVQESLLKAMFLAPRKAESQYWMGKFYFALGKYDVALKFYDTARGLIGQDNTLSKSGGDVLMSGALFDESTIYLLKGDNKYTSYIKEAFKYDPVKTFYLLDKNPALKKMQVALVEGNLFLMAKFKP